MKKYNIEGDIDFYKELYESFDEKEPDSYDDKCLISNCSLVDKYVTMACGHKFNYVPLYHDLVNHRLKFNGMEGTAGSLKYGEIRCPYCRSKQTGILPFYEDFGLQKVIGVNIPYVNPNTIKCEFTSPNIYFDPDLPEDALNFTHVKCNCYGSQITGNNYGDTKNYCYDHKKVVIGQHKNNIKNDIKKTKLAAKLASKLEMENKKKEKDLETSEIKKSLDLMQNTFEEYTKLQILYVDGLKMRRKKIMFAINNMKVLTKGVPNNFEPMDHVSTDTGLSDLNNMMNEMCVNICNLYNSFAVGESESQNVIVVPSITIDVPLLNPSTGDAPKLCGEILKSGKNEGLPCCKQVFEGVLCKMHYNLKNANKK